MKKAFLVEQGLAGYQGFASLYRLDTPIAQTRYTDVGEEEITHEYVVVSSANVPFSGPETYIFPADKDGNVVNWSELSGSVRGDFSHEETLARAGYTVSK